MRRLVAQMREIMRLMERDRAENATREGGFSDRWTDTTRSHHDSTHRRERGYEMPKDCPYQLFHPYLERPSAG